MSSLLGGILLSMCGLFPTDGFSQVCGKGVAVPPFLSSGASANLMMVLDNSGSMLDMAYVDADTQCFDETYTSSKTYAGYFEEDSWYTWQSDTAHWDATASGSDSWVAHWKQNTSYTDGQIVYANGGLYKATRNGISDDANANDGLNISGDTGDGSPGWIPISQATTVTSLADNCTDSDLVAYNNSVYICQSNSWVRLEGGQFVKINPATYPDPESYCDTNTFGEKYQFSGELCTRVKEREVSGYTVQEQMYLFAARGNLLNWAMTSKFDVQKEILTGGKYVEDDEGNNGQLVSESRGCAGFGFVKQVSVSKDGGTTSSKLVMRVRGANNDDRVGDLPKNENTDDTTRIEIIGITASGFDQGACQTVIDKLMTDPNTLSQNQINNCMSGTNQVGASQAALSTTVAACAALWRQDLLNPQPGDLGNLVSTVADKCEDLFVDYGYSPSTMSPQDGGGGVILLALYRVIKK
ncbi:MAG: hypothetical protein D3910_15505 [Candidatus Electrothrix sp. ATG2]|nr:hypothetical protein [Candidatus Electrothrix sp. ATG2]